jgi:hypothetical protein
MASLQVPSGRGLSAEVRSVDADGTLVLSVESVSAVPPGSVLELRWPDRGRWWSLRTVVAEPRRGDHPDAGLLRLQPEGDPVGRPDRRRGGRRGAVLTVTVTVRQSANVMPGTELRAWVEDLGAGGLSFDAELDLEPGDRLSLALTGDAGLPLDRAEARVVRSERPPGALARRVGVVYDPPRGA